MATDVNVFNIPIVGGVLDLTTGTGIYNVFTENGDPTDTINQIIGAAHPHIYELRVAVPGQYWTLDHNPAAGINLQRQLGFATASPADKIVIRAWEVGSGVDEYFRVLNA